MTVKELIELLEQVDEDAVVIVRNPYPTNVLFQFFVDVETISIVEKADENGPATVLIDC